MPPKVSIIAVNYHSRDLITHLKKSLQESRFYNYEFIVIDNDKKNIGYGPAVNQGASRARGEYLFVLNPDTLAFPDTLSTLVDFLDTRPDAAIAAPLLFDSQNNPYPWVGTQKLTPLQGILSLSFINKLWPNHGFWVETKHLYSPVEIGVAPGTAFLIRKSVFNRIGGFDPKFFLYFEESDLCLRIRRLGEKIFLLPQAKLIHYWGKSTPHSPAINKIFAASRYYYFRKHFGLVWALIVELFARLSPLRLFVTILMFITFFLRFYKLDQVPYFDDMGWFYASARNSLYLGQFPLQGITASLTWLHQGPLWTYLLIPISLHFNSTSPVILTNIMNIVTIPLIYYLGSLWFNKRTGLLSALIFTASPQVINYSRQAYHTSPIPLFLTIFLLSLSRRKYFLAALFLGFLYHLHLLTFILWPLVFLTLILQKYRPRPVHLFGLILGFLPTLLTSPLSPLRLLKWAFFLPHPSQMPVSMTQYFYSQISQFLLPQFPLVSASLFLFCLRPSRHHLWFFFPALLIFSGRVPTPLYFTLLLVPLSLFIGHGLSRLSCLTSFSILFILLILNTLSQVIQ